MHTTPVLTTPRAVWSFRGDKKATVAPVNESGARKNLAPLRLPRSRSITNARAEAADADKDMLIAGGLPEHVVTQLNVGARTLMASLSGRTSASFFQLVPPRDSRSSADGYSASPRSGTLEAPCQIQRF